VGDGWIRTQVNVISNCGIAHYLTDRGITPGFCHLGDNLFARPTRPQIQSPSHR
jgi:hypothetical protein